MGIVLMRRYEPEENAETLQVVLPGPTMSGCGPGRFLARTDSAAPLETDAPRTTLFCIPHAGGSATYYAKLKSFPARHVAFQPLEMAGRGRRSREPLATNMDDIAHDLFRHIAPVARTAPYAIFGHSMGALLALLCTMQARAAGLPLPQALFVSACAPPDAMTRKSSAPVSSLSPEHLWRHVEQLGGIPTSIAASAEFRAYLTPILHADFTALDSWRPEPVPPLPVPIAVFLGDQDAVGEPVARGWRKYTTGGFSMHAFRGNHFYLQDHWEALAAHMTQTISGLHHAG